MHLTVKSPCLSGSIVGEAGGKEGVLTPVTTLPLLMLGMGSRSNEQTVITIAKNYSPYVYGEQKELIMVALPSTGAS